MKAVPNGTRSQEVRCGNEQDDNELPSTAKMTGGSGIRTSDLFEVTCLIRLTTAGCPESLFCLKFIVDDALHNASSDLLNGRVERLPEKLLT